MSPLPCAVIGIICYLWSHNKVCHGAFSVIIFLFVSSRAADSGGAGAGRGRAAGQGPRGANGGSRRWCHAQPMRRPQPAPPGAAAFPTDTGSERALPGKPSAPHLTHGFPQNTRPGTQPAESCPALRGQRVQKGLWFGAPSGGALKALN